MADNDNAESEAPKSSSPGDIHAGQMLGINIIGKIVGVITAIWLISISYAAFIFFVLGMLPAIMAAFLDRGAGRFASKTVSAFNFIGIAPYLFEIARNYERSLAARRLMSQIDVWAFIYGTSMIGWAMIWLIPQITLLIYILRADIRIESLKEEQQNLIDEWGEEVKT